MTDSVGFRRILGELQMGKRPIQMGIASPPAKRRRIQYQEPNKEYFSNNLSIRGSLLGPTRSVEVHAVQMRNLDVSSKINGIPVHAPVTPQTAIPAGYGQYEHLGTIREVSGASFVNNELMLFVKFKGAAEGIYVPAEFANKSAPQAVIRFYQSRLCQPIPQPLSVPALNKPKSPLLTVIRQPPAKAVYQRLLKPFPAVALVGVLDASHQYYVEATLLRNGTNSELDFLVGGKILNINPECPTLFKKLKITTTSQRQSTLFRLCFKLKRYENEQLIEVAGGTVTTAPIEVFSHTTYLKKDKKITAKVVNQTLAKLVPDNGPASGGNTVAILGSGFVATSHVWFGHVQVPVTVHDQSTLLCTAPKRTTDETVSITLTNPAKGSEGLVYTYRQS